MREHGMGRHKDKKAIGSFVWQVDVVNGWVNIVIFCDIINESDTYI